MQRLTSRLSSFRHAIRGMICVVGTQANAWIHMAATVVVVGLGILLRLTTSEWCLIVLAVSSVWTAEAFNTALEKLSDVASPDIHPDIRDAKDMAAGAVLAAACGAAVVGLIVFVPKLIR